MVIVEAPHSYAVRVLPSDQTHCSSQPRPSEFDRIALTLGSSAYEGSSLVEGETLPPAELGQSARGAIREWRSRLGLQLSYAQFACGISGRALCGRIAVDCRYTSQAVGPSCRSMITTLPSFDSARRCVSSLAPLKNVNGADTVNRETPPYCSTHCSRVPKKLWVCADLLGFMSSPLNVYRVYPGDESLRGQTKVYHVYPGEGSTVKAVVIVSSFLPIPET